MVKWITGCYGSFVATGCGVLATAVLTSVTASVPASAEDLAVSGHAPGTGLASIDDTRESIEDLRQLLRVGKRDLADLKTLASRLGAAMGDAQSVDAPRALELSEQRRRVLDEVSTLHESLPRIQARARELSSEVDIAERVYRACLPEGQFSCETGGE